MEGGRKGDEHGRNRQDSQFRDLLWPRAGLSLALASHAAPVDLCSPWQIKRLALNLGKIWELRAEITRSGRLAKDY